MAKRDIYERFWEKVLIRSDEACWEWQATRNNKGYGLFTISAAVGKQLAHRFSYETRHGRIPVGLSVMHSCDNPRCVNPAHLSVGTHQENLRDMARKGRWRNSGVRGESVGTSKLTDEQVIAIRQAYIDNE